MKKPLQCPTCGYPKMLKAKNGVWECWACGKISFKGVKE